MGKKSDIKSSEITPKDIYMNRRQFIAGTTAAIAGLASFEPSLSSGADSGQRLKVEKRGQYTLQAVHRRLDTEFYFDYTCHIATSKDHMDNMAKRDTKDDRALCLLLCQPSLHKLYCN